MKHGLIKIDIRKLRLPNGRTFEQQMKYEAKRFLKILQEEIDDWYMSYSPVVYQRTYAMRDSIYAEDVVDIDTSGMQLTIKIKQTDAAMHKSLWGDGEVMKGIRLKADGIKTFPILATVKVVIFWKEPLNALNRKTTSILKFISTIKRRTT